MPGSAILRRPRDMMALRFRVSEATACLVGALVVLLLSGCTGAPPAPAPAEPAERLPSLLALPTPAAVPERLSLLEKEHFNRIWAQIDVPVDSGNVVAQFARSQTLLHRLVQRPATRSGVQPPYATPVALRDVSPMMAERFGPVTVRDWAQQVLDWQSRHRDLLGATLGLDDTALNRLLHGSFHVGDPVEHALVAWGRPARLLHRPGGQTMELVYANGPVRRVVVAEGVVRVIRE